MKRLIFLVVTLFIMTACVSPRVTTKTVIPTVSPSISPPVTAASSATATETPRPTATLLYLTPPPTNAPTADVEDWAYYGWTSTSSDGKWVADFFVRPFKIYHHTGRLLWEFPHDSTLDFNGGITMDVFGWSLDSRYVYFAPSVSNCGGYLRSLDINEGLWRLDITSGEIKVILAIPEEFELRSIAVLLDKGLLAYVNRGSESMPVDLIIQSLDNGEEIVRYPIGNDAFIVGSLRWSPDGKKIIYIKLVVDEYNERERPEVYRYLLMMIDVETGEKTLLLDMGDPGYFIYQLEENNIIKLKEVGYRKGCEVYDFDIYTKEFVSFVTVTPDPKYAEMSEYQCESTPTPTP